MFETSVFATARLRGEKWRKDPHAPLGELLVLLLLQNLGLDSVEFRRPIIQPRLRSGGGNDASRFREQIRRRL